MRNELRKRCVPRLLKGLIPFNERELIGVKAETCSALMVVSFWKIIRGEVVR